MPAPVRPNNYYSENTPAENGGGASSEEKPAAKSILEKPAAPLDIRKRVNIFMTNPKSGGWGARCFILFDVLMIILSALNFFIETIDGIDMSAIRSIELVTNIFFSAEIAALTWAGTVDPKKMILLNMFYWIDIVNIIPFYGGLVADSIGAAPGVKTGLRFIMMLRPLRILKMQVASVQTRVLILALHNSWRALLVPCFAMFMMISVLSAAMYLAEEQALGPPDPDDEDRYQNAFDAMWAMFWIISTMGYDGYIGSSHTPGKIIVVISIMCGILFTTMPITIIGEAFRAAWEKKEILEVQMKIQDILVQRGLTTNELSQVFKELDSSGDGNLDWGEFKTALTMLKVKVPVSKARALFAEFDEDETGEIDFGEFCRILFPDLEELPEFDAGEGGEEAEAPAAASLGPAAKNASGGGGKPMSAARMQLQALQDGAGLDPNGSNGAAAAGGQGGLAAMLAARREAAANAPGPEDVPTWEEAPPPGADS